MSRISIIIPHYNNKDILYRCIESLSKLTYKDFEIIVVDNNSSDNSPQDVQRVFSNFRIIKSKQNLGYAGGCNLGAKSSESEFLLFLNNDTIHDNNFIQPLIRLLDSDQSVASVQPKLLNINKRDFDYAGACGGYIDYLVFPFTRGRIFNSIEKDQNQYDDKKEIFWASGACFITRKSIFVKCGGFDEKLFAHMEEIDFHWKSHMLDMSVYVEPKSIIYHEGGATLNKKSSKKLYLNHRNSLVLLLTNYSFFLSIYLFPLRLILELISSFKELLSLNFISFLNHYRAILWNLLNIHYLISRRRFNKKIRQVTDKAIFNKGIISHQSIVRLYFISGIKKYSKIK